MRTATLTVLPGADRPGPPVSTTITSERVWTIGRAEDSDIVVDDNRVSRRHLIVENYGGAWILRDVSTYGSWAGNARIGPGGVPIPDDGELRVHLGDSAGPELVVSGVPAPAPVAAPVAPVATVLPYQAAAPQPYQQPIQQQPFQPPAYQPPPFQPPPLQPVGQQPPFQPVVQRRGPSRRSRWLIAVLAVLVILFVVADRIAASVASTTAVQQVVQRSEGLGTMPTVSFGGFPFLTQVAFGKYSDIAVGINDITPPGGPRIEHLTAHLEGAHIPLSKAIHNDIKTIPIDHVAATVAIRFADLNGFLKGQNGGLTLNMGKNGAVQISGTLDLDGQQVAIAGSAKLSAENGQVTVEPEDVHVSGTGGFDDLINSLGGMSSLLPPIPVPLPDLPFNLRITGIHAGNEGIVASATADHVVLDASQ